MQVIIKSSLLLSSFLVVSQAIAAPPRAAPEPLPIVGAAPALDDKSEQRLNLLEKKLDNNVIYDLLEQIEKLQREVSDLRGFSEQQGYQMEVLTKRQRSLYQDVDRRILELEAGSASSSGVVVNQQVEDTQSSSGLTVVTDTSEGNVSSTSGIAPITVTDEATEYAEYKKAFNLLKEGNYSQSIIAFRAFLLAYGTGKYADNAQYWIGEGSYATRDYKTALVEFQKIATDYPDSSKRKDAELKIGFTYYELKDWSASQRALNAVVRQYPGTSNARTAQQRLDRIAREGR